MAIGTKGKLKLRVGAALEVPIRLMAPIRQVVREDSTIILVEPM